MQVLSLWFNLILGLKFSFPLFQPHQASGGSRGEAQGAAPPLIFRLRPEGPKIFLGVCLHPPSLSKDLDDQAPLINLDPALQAIGELSFNQG